MSYARTGEDSDLYVYMNVQGTLVCCSCPGKSGGDFTTSSVEVMERHVKAHRDAGLKVPDSCLSRLAGHRLAVDGPPRTYHV